MILLVVGLFTGIMGVVDVEEYIRLIGDAVFATRVIDFAGMSCFEGTEGWLLGFVSGNVVRRSHGTHD